MKVTICSERCRAIWRGFRRLKILAPTFSRTSLLGRASDGDEGFRLMVIDSYFPTSRYQLRFYVADWMILALTRTN